MGSNNNGKLSEKKFIELLKKVQDSEICKYRLSTSPYVRVAILSPSGTLHRLRGCKYGTGVKLLDNYVLSALKLNKYQLCSVCIPSKNAFIMEIKNTKKRKREALKKRKEKKKEEVKSKRRLFTF